MSPRQTCKTCRGNGREGGCPGWVDEHDQHHRCGRRPRQYVSPTWRLPRATLAQIAAVADARNVAASAVAQAIIELGLAAAKDPEKLRQALASVCSSKAEG